jgi:prepilin peptidase CpaA
MDSILIILIVSAITISVIEDLRREKIPNLVTFPTMVMALAYHTLATGLNGFLFSAGGLGVGMGLFIIPYIMGGMGAGDVKLMGAVGAIFGPKGIIIASIMVILAGGVYGVMLMAMHPRYTALFLKRQWLTFKTFILTRHFILVPPGRNETRPVLKYAIPIAIGALGYMAMLLTGYDLFPQVLGEKFEILSIALYKGGT